MPAYRSKTSTAGRNMAGARSLWRATGMKDDDFSKPIVAVVNSFTQFVPGHVHLKDLGQLVAREIEAAGGVAKGETGLAWLQHGSSPVQCSPFLLQPGKPASACLQLPRLNKEIVRFNLIPQISRQYHICSRRENLISRQNH